ncbi:hypothetical protein GCM10007853_21620 [Algimonas ampicilliniresistens]|uniref:Uncharacterized protein n=1 Tax=Algimonas ampicilliniresistens TaxID=1298735 RepID=A0ABQ5V9X6_9PROT|nr:hypothetical protein [Algimonas ampicilliniresistens]GLQ24288.1 hypothetical protein GCM10007853_21620 [Algimonas ampicilliniresistens]
MAAPLYMIEMEGSVRQRSQNARDRHLLGVIVIDEQNGEFWVARGHKGSLP